MSATDIPLAPPLDTPAMAEGAAVPAPAPDAVSAAATPDTEPGSLLRNARERSGLSLGDVAARLRMGVKQIDTLEKGDYAALPQGTYLRGFVRNYAKAVGLPVDEALALLERHYGQGQAVSATCVVEPSAPPDSMQIGKPPGLLTTPNGRAIATAIAVAILLGAAFYWWEFIRPHRATGGRPVVEPIAVKPAALPAVPAAGGETAPASDPAYPLSAPVVESAVPAAATPLPTADNPATSLAAAKPAEPKTASVPLAAKALPAAAPVEPAPTADRKSDAGADKKKLPAQLGFTFSGDSWVEVTDSSGKTILSRRYKAGETDEVAGRAPLAIVIGNAAATRMAYNGKEFDLSPHTSAKAGVARLTVK